MTRFPRLTSIQSRLGIIFLAFLSLLVISVVVTFIGLETQRQDARVINLAGRQRMLLQQMTSLALGYEQEQADSYTTALQVSVDSFEQTLNTMRNGGKIIDYTGNELILAPPQDPNLKLELESLDREWVAYHEDVNRLLDSGISTPKDAVVKDIEYQSASIIGQADRVVQAFEVVSNEKITRLRSFQMIFLGAGLVLLSAGWWVTHKSVVLPFAQLDKFAERIGVGDLNAPIILQGPEEARVLGRTMDAMRTQVLTSRQELQQWAATLENRVQQRTRELEALAAVSREISSHLSIGDVLNSVTIKARELSGSEVASLCLLDTQGKVLSLHAAAGPESAIQKNQSPAQGPIIGEVLHQHCAHPCGLQSSSGFCMIIDPVFRTSHMAAPLYSRDKVIGALCVGSSQQDVFRPEMALVLAQLSDVAAVALENSRLYQQAEHAATLEERQRIASEMHDGLLQTLSFLGLMVQWAKDHMVEGNLEKALSTLQQIERAEEQAEHEIRRAIASLQDDFPLNYTLQEQLAVLADELSKTNPPVLFETESILPMVLPHQESEQVLRVVREALLNAQRYSQSDTVHLSMKEDQNEIILTVQDQGVGFDCGVEPNDSRAHFGIKIMKARAVRLGGELTIQSVPRAGTMVQLRWTPASIIHHSREG